MHFFLTHILSFLLLLPLTSALIVALLPGNRSGLIRNMALSGAVLTLALSVLVLTLFDSGNPGMQLFEHVVWNPRLGTSYAVGIDGFSLPMIILTSVLCLIALMASASIKEHVKGYYLLMLLLETAILGVFVAQDWALFYVFWEMTLIPLFFLIDRWGGENRQMAALNFVLYTMGGSVFMLVSLLVLFDSVPERSFSMAAMFEAAHNLPPHKQVMIFLGLFIGFGVKMPIFPIHGWLPLAHVEAPSPVSILLSGILLKMGAYGIIRASGMLPEAMTQLQVLLVSIALFSIIYGGLLAWRQRDIKKMIAYSSVSHMGVVLLGISTLNVIGMTGAVAQMTAHGLVAGATFMLIGLLYERTHTRDIADYSSLTRITPRFAFFLILAFIAAVGMPGTFGFVAELHALIGGFQQWGWWMILVSIGVVISAIYAIRTIGRLFTGPVRSGMNDIEDMRPMEMIAASILVGSILILGLMPAGWLALSKTSIEQLVRLFQ
jgi:NADH-quinone oxidoreductase subunit M